MELLIVQRVEAELVAAGSNAKFWLQNEKQEKRNYIIYTKIKKCEGGDQEAPSFFPRWKMDSEGN